MAVTDNSIAVIGSEFGGAKALLQERLLLDKYSSVKVVGLHRW